MVDHAALQALASSKNVPKDASKRLTKAFLERAKITHREALAVLAAASLKEESFEESDIEEDDDGNPLPTPMHSCFAAAPPELLADKDAMMAAVQANGGVLRHASEALRGDIDLVSAAVAQGGGRVFEHATEGLKADREAVLKVVGGVDGRALAHVAEPLRAEKEIVLAACASRGAAILHASEALRGDRDVVLAALTSAGTPADPLDVLDEDSGCGKLFRSDREIVRAPRCATARRCAMPPTS